MISDIPAPRIPLAEPDGVIKLSDLQKDVPVYMKILTNAQPRDVYQLLLDGQPVGHAYPLPDPAPKPGSTLIMMLDNDELANADSYQVGYRHKTHPGAYESDSAATPIRIDRTSVGTEG